MVSERDSGFVETSEGLDPIRPLSDKGQDGARAFPSPERCRDR